MKYEQPNDPVFIGKEHVVVLPSGRKITLREANGADEEELTRLSDLNNGESSSKYLSNIITHDSYLNRKPTFEEVSEYPLNDHTLAFIQQRIINFGAELKFSWECNNDSPKCRHKFDLTEDLSELIPANWDNPSDNQIKKYPKYDSEGITFTIASGKEFRFKLMTASSQRNLLEKGNERTSNSNLVARSLEYKIEGKFTPIYTFHYFSVREMAEIRAYVSKYDDLWSPMSEFKCPKCGAPYIVPITTLPTFFLPEVAI